MSKKNKISLIISCVIILVAIILGILWQQGFLGGEKGLLKVIQGRPDLLALFDKTKAIEEKISKDLANAAWHLELGMTWKSIAERGGGEPFFEKSLDAYEYGIKKFGKQNILFYLNGGKLAERLDANAKAERYYKKAIEISPADESGYLYLADLYSYKMFKPKEDVLRVYSLGLSSQMVGTIPIIAARASYLRRIGDWAGALTDYRVLSENFPNNQGFKDVIKELEAATTKTNTN